MLKYLIASVILLLSIYSFVDIDKDDNSYKEYTVPETAVLDFSYDMKMLDFKQLLNEDKRDLLKAHQKFSFIPQEEKIRVQGYLNKNGSPYMEITILEKSNRPWIILENQSDENQKSQIKKIVMEGNRVISYDKKDKIISDLKTDNNDHKALVNAIQEKVDPTDNFKKFIEESVKNGWILKEAMDGTLILKNVKKDTETLMYFDPETSLPKYSKISNIREVTTIIYKYECIDGKWVLVMQRTGIIKKEADPEEPMMEDVLQLNIDNYSINFSG